MRTATKTVKARKPLGLPGFIKAQGLVKVGYREAASAIRKELKRTESAADFNTWTAATAAFALARRLERNEALWAKFCEEQFWSSGYKPRKNSFLRSSCIYLYGDKNGPIGQHARRNARQMQVCWDDGWTAKEVFTELHQPPSGFQRLQALKKDRPSNAGERKIVLLVGKADTSIIDSLEIGEGAWIGVENTAKGKSPKLKIVVIRSK